MRQSRFRRTASRPILMASVAAVAAAAFGLGASPARAAYAAHVQAGTLQVTGDGAGDKLALRLAPGAPNTLQLDVGQDGTADFSFDRTTFTAIDVHAGGGDDELRIDQSGGLFTDEQVTLDGGSGDDTVVDGDGADTLLGGKGSDFVDGNRGSDLALLGAGADVFQWDPGDGSDAVEGQGGNDRLDFNGSNIGEHTAVRASGSRVRLTRDVAAITMDLVGIDTVALRMLGGADTLTVGDLTATATKHVNVDLAATGGSGDGSADTVIAEGSDSADKVAVANADGDIAVNGLAAVTRVSGDEAADRVDVS